MLKFLKTRKLSVVLLAVIVLLIFLHYVGILKPIENLAIRMLAPVQYRVYSLGSNFNGFYSNFVTSRNLFEENKRLEEELKELTIADVQLRTQFEEIKAMASQRDFLESSGFQAVIARVIGKNPEPSRQVIILNKGSKDGIKVDFPLITDEGIIVGKISQIKSNSAEAVLINDSASRIAALVQNENNSQGIVMGEHGLSLKLELISQNEAIKEGDIVVTSGLEPAIPKGLIIGKISQVLTEPNSFFQTASIRPLVKIDNLTVVSVLIGPEDD